MSYQPVIPITGYAGWQFLARTRDAQQEAFDRSPAIARETAYFEERIGAVTSAQDLVSDRRLLAVALGAFGLDDDINNRFFLQKVLEDGTLDSSALANRLADKRYSAFSKAFGFGDFDTPSTVLSDFGAKITAQFRDRQFEIAVGRQDESMRLALGLERALDEIVATDTSADGRWYAVMGRPPVRQVFEAALGLPASFGALDLDRQLTGFRDKAGQRFGDGEVAQFADPARREELLRLFLARSEGTPAVPGTGGASVALSLLQSMARPAL